MQINYIIEIRLMQIYDTFGFSKYLTRRQVVFLSVKQKRSYLHSFLKVMTRTHVNHQFKSDSHL